MIFSPEQTCVVASVALLAGVISAIAGSGGLIILPSLMLAGMPPQLALGTGKMLTTSGLVTSACLYCRRGLFKPQLWIAAIVATAFGAMMGAILATLMHTEVLNRLLPMVIFMVAIYVALPLKKISNPQQQKTVCRKTCGVLGSLLGIYSGLIGAATGAMWTSLVMRFFHLDLLEANALSRVMCAISNGVALLVFILSKNVDYEVGLVLVVMSSLGAWIGSNLTLRFGQQLIRPLVILTTSLMALKLFHSAWLA